MVPFFHQQVGPIFKDHQIGPIFPPTFFYLAKFALLDQLSAIQLKLFNVNFRLSNQISIFFLWWQCPITPKELVCLIFRMIIKSPTLDIMFLPSYRWKENSDIRRSMNLQIIVNGMSFHSRLRIEKTTANCLAPAYSRPRAELPYLSSGGDQRQMPIVFGRTIIIHPATEDFPGIPTWNSPVIGDR